MPGLDLRGLIGKLNPVCQRSLEGAAGLCLSRTNYNVEIEHWLVKLLEQPGNDVCHQALQFIGQLVTSPGELSGCDGGATCVGLVHVLFLNG